MKNGPTYSYITPLVVSFINRADFTLECHEAQLLAVRTVNRWQNECPPVVVLSERWCKNNSIPTDVHIIGLSRWIFYFTARIHPPTERLHVLKLPVNFVGYFTVLSVDVTFTWRVREKPRPGYPVSRTRIEQSAPKYESGALPMQYELEMKLMLLTTHGFTPFNRIITASLKN